MSCSNDVLLLGTQCLNVANAWQPRQSYKGSHKEHKRMGWGLRHPTLQGRGVWVYGWGLYGIVILWERREENKETPCACNQDRRHSADESLPHRAVSQKRLNTVVEPWLPTALSIQHTHNIHADTRFRPLPLLQPADTAVEKSSAFKLSCDMKARHSSCSE